MDPAAWDERYREKPLLWSAGPNRFVEEDLAGLTPGTALDVACGEGRNAIWLAERGWEVTGVDFAPVALSRARHIAGQRGVAVHWVEADVSMWDPGRTFDLVLVTYVHFSEWRRLLHQAVGWVAPGGHLHLVGHDVSTAGVSGPSDPTLLWDVASVVEQLPPLSVVTSGRRTRLTDAGEEAFDTVVLAVRRV